MLDIKLLEGNDSFKPPSVRLNVLGLQPCIGVFNWPFEKKKFVENIKTLDDKYDAKILLSFSKEKCTNLKRLES